MTTFSKTQLANSYNENPLFGLLTRMLPNIPRDVMTHFAAQLNPTLCQWQKGMYLFEMHQPFSQMIIIKSGLVRSFYLDDTDTAQDINIRFLGDNSAALPFAAVAENWLRRESACIATETLQCVTDVTGFRIPLAVFEENTLFNQTIKAEIALRHYVSVEQRLRLLKTPKAADRYAIFQATLDACIVAGMPNYHVASYLGITPETLSRLKADLKKK